MFRVVTFKLRKRQYQKLQDTLELCRVLYNAALEQRILAHRRQHKSLSYFDQCRDLTDLRKDNDQFRSLAVECVRLTVLKRLQKAFDGFFRRLKTSQKAGFPRFRGKGRFNTLVFGTAGWKIKGHRLYLKGIGSFTVRGDVKHVSGKKCQGLQIIHRGDCWEAQVLVNIGQSPSIKQSKHAVGIDVGLTTFAKLSDNGVIEHPHFLREASDNLCTAQRSLSRKQRGSKRRAEAKLLLSRVSRRVANKRRDFLHQTTRQLVNRYDGFAVEKLNIQQMMQQSPDDMSKKQARGLHRNIMDSAWANFRFYLAYKAEEAGMPFMEVDPKGTSQRCSGCGSLVRKTLRDRIHKCPACGLEIDRDLNAAINILACGTQAAPDLLRCQCPNRTVLMRG